MVNVRLTTHCRRGHPWKVETTRYYLRPDGIPYRICMTCKNAINLLWSKNEYRHNSDYRKVRKTKALSYYYRVVKPRKLKETQNELPDHTSGVS